MDAVNAYVTLSAIKVDLLPSSDEGRHHCGKCPGDKQLVIEGAQGVDREPGDAAPAGPDGAVSATPPARNTIRSQDLVSLPVLRALLRERNVTRAGETVGLTQSATSNALARLRRRFGDELLVRAGREYHLTPLAQSLLDRADSAVDALERLFEDTFEPGTSTREFTLTLSDYSLIVLSSTLVPILRREAPRIRLELRQLSTAFVDFEELLRQSDGVILPPAYIRGHPSVALLKDEWACLVGSDADVEAAVTTEDLARLPWVAPFGRSMFSGSPPVRELRRMGIEPHVEVTVDGFLAVPFVVAGTNRVSFVPLRLAQRFSGMAGIRLLPSPLPRNDHVLSLYWDATETNDPGHLWFRSSLRRAAADAMLDPPPELRPLDLALEATAGQQCDVSGNNRAEPPRLSSWPRTPRRPSAVRSRARRCGSDHSVSAPALSGHVPDLEGDVGEPPGYCMRRSWHRYQPARRRADRGRLDRGGHARRPSRTASWRCPRLTVMAWLALRW